MVGRQVQAESLVTSLRSRGHGTTDNTMIGPLRTDLAVVGAAHRVSLSAHQPLSETTHHLTQQVVVVGLELLAVHTNTSTLLSNTAYLLTVANTSP